MQDSMEADAPASPVVIGDLLKASAEYKTPVAEALNKLTISDSPSLSEELSFLKDIEPDPTTDSSCLITTYSLKKSPLHLMLGLEKRPSSFFFERACFASLYQKLIELWTKTEREKIVLTGNAGTGKSWFQVYFLRRLLTERQKALFRFVVRQVGARFYLIDADTCSGYTVEKTGDIMDLLSNHGKILYMYEPQDKVDQPPLLVGAPSFSTLSPRPRRIKEYRKSGPSFLYMPAWEFNELEIVAAREGMEGSMLDYNFLLFGGIIRHTLEQNSKKVADNKKEMIKRCKTVTPAMLRSVAADVDDDPDADDGNNISGFVVSYTDIPQAGEDTFMTTTLAMTSEFARQTVLEKMNLQSPHEHLDMLTKHLKGKHRDITGKDLEVSVVHLLAAGPMAVPWEYHAVGGVAPRPKGTRLPLTQRTINRDAKFDDSKINYPSETMFGLADCFAVVGSMYWAFQTSWQTDHAFKLVTLWAFRVKLGLGPGDPLNLLFVNPEKAETYRKRAKAKYLEKGERPDKPLKNSKKEIVLNASDVALMWKNTHIFVAFPEGNTWEEAIRKYLELDHKLKPASH